jgi:two-component system nitrogen regulation sensor histidine kinase NtrY
MIQAARRSGLRRFIKILRVVGRQYGLERKLAFAVAIAAIFFGLVTVVAWTGPRGLTPDRDTVIWLLYVDAILVLVLGAVVGRQIVKVWSERRRGMAGSGLHVRIVLLFSLVAVAPAILVAVFSALFLNFGLQAWFNERVRTAVFSSEAIAQSYLEEHRKNIRAEAFAMANALEREAPALMRNRRFFDSRLAVEARVRSLSEALVVDGSGRVVARDPLSLTLEMDRVPEDAVEQASLGEIVVLTADGEERVRALVKLDRFIDYYLVVGRFIQPEVLQNIERTEVAVNQYRWLEESREGILITFVVIFIVVALLLLLAAVWIGLGLATQISKPISTLVIAAERVRKGDLRVRVKNTGSPGEIETLSRAFNRMTSQLESQHDGLLHANRHLEERRRFTEAVLSGVSAGVIGIDADGLIELPNRSASELLECDLRAAIGQPLAQVVPEMAPLLNEAQAGTKAHGEQEIKVIRDGRTRNLFARIVNERRGQDIVGFVVTFDDITARVEAERKAAWADVARRIAHEIKNPLTPIQLASERLKRKYMSEVTSDPEAFRACTDTIGRQVDDIRRMVDEFSSFARMPRARLNRENFSEITAQCVFLEQNRHQDITIDLALPPKPVHLVCDARQVSQALTNILKNAAEAILGRNETAAMEPGHISVTLENAVDNEGSGTVTLSVKDNGRGLPAEDRHRLTEPYVTTRQKGTGLGLAIVKKIMEDHSGDLMIEDRKGGGADVRLVFKTIGRTTTAADGEAAADHDTNSDLGERVVQLQGRKTS